jgi:hypothetical protein
MPALFAAACFDCGCFVTGAFGGAGEALIFFEAAGDFFFGFFGICEAPSM